MVGYWRTLATPLTVPSRATLRVTGAAPEVGVLLLGGCVAVSAAEAAIFSESPSLTPDFSRADTSSSTSTRLLKAADAAEALSATPFFSRLHR